jgi:hypothetical protein
MEKQLMNRKVIYSALIGSTLCVCIFYGVAIHKFRVFPYSLLKIAYVHIIQSDQEELLGPWSIGVYEGADPFSINDPGHISNPVLTWQDVTDVQAKFVADPFIIHDNNRFMMFFEVMNRTKKRGVIGYADSSDGRKWNYRRIVIDEPFHLSYPCVFKWEGSYYLVPESCADLSVRLYKATKFPDEWEFVGKLLSGYRYVDPTIFRHNDKWWLFVTTDFSPYRGTLNVYYSNKLQEGWTPHPMNPVVRGNSHIASPGGRLFSHKGRIYRPAMDCSPRYGTQIFLLEITGLSETVYSERMFLAEPVIGPTGIGWNSDGMHQLDVLKVGNRWVAAVDGKCR